jgi:hypothetical protein
LSGFSGPDASKLSIRANYTSGPEVFPPEFSMDASARLAQKTPSGNARRERKRLKSIEKAGKSGLARHLHSDLQRFFTNAVCQQPARGFILPVPVGGSTFPAGTVLFLRGFPLAGVLLSLATQSSAA